MHASILQSQQQDMLATQNWVDPVGTMRVAEIGCLLR